MLARKMEISINWLQLESENCFVSGKEKKYEEVRERK